eukprot:IDg4852t1
MQPASITYDCEAENCENAAEYQYCSMCKTHCPCKCGQFNCEEVIDHYRCGKCDIHCVCSERTDSLMTAPSVTYGADVHIVCPSISSEVSAIGSQGPSLSVRPPEGGFKGHVVVEYKGAAWSANTMS